MLTKSRILLRGLVLGLVISLVPLISTIPSLENIGMSLEAAEGDVEVKKKKKKRKRAKLPSKKAQKIFQQIQPLLESEVWEEANILLSSIKRGEKFTDTDRATMWYYYGYIYFSQEKYDLAIKAYNTLIKTPNADYRQKNNAIYSLSQLSYIKGDYRGAIKYLYLWLENEDEPSSDAYALLATTYYQLKEFKNAKSNIEIAISMQESRDVPVLDENGEETGKTKKGVARENHYLLKMALFQELKQKLDVLPIYEILVQHYPKKRYWVQLSGLYGSRDRQLDQMAALEAAYDDDLLDKEREFVALAQLLMMHQNPFKAARVMENGFNREIIKEKEKTLKAMGQYWHAAKELKKAKPAYKKAAKLSKEGELYVFLGQVHFGLDEYKDAEFAIREGIKKGKLKDLANAYMILGQIQFEYQKWEDAIASFRRCIDVAERSLSDKKEKEKKKKKKIQDSARKWITYTEGEEERVVALELKKKALGI